jgi:hypothetical protein
MQIHFIFNRDKLILIRGLSAEIDVIDIYYMVDDIFGTV